MTPYKGGSGDKAEYATQDQMADIGGDSFRIARFAASTGLDSMTQQVALRIARIIVL